MLCDCADERHVARPVRRKAAVGFDPQRCVLRPATFSTLAGTETTDSVVQQRRRAVDHSDWYYRRLAIHKGASCATVPVFVTEYILGDKLSNGDAGGSVKFRSLRSPTGIAVPMLASDAGFVATAALAPEGEGEFDAGNSNDDRTTHRVVAMASMGVSLVSYLMMYLWK